jgi:hypothetical protein
MSFATDNDLVTLVPDIYDHNVDYWGDEIARAEEDIIRKIRTEWYNKRYSRYNWDQAELVESQWTQATLYRALGYYILPRLTQWRTEGDSFQQQMEFYQARFADEINDQFSIGIQYDYNGDSVIDETENYPSAQTRLWR